MHTGAVVQAKKAKPSAVIGWFLMAAGLLLMASGSFSYTRKSYTAKLNSIELSVGERQRVYLLIWTGVAAFVAGGGIFLTRPKTVL